MLRDQHGRFVLGSRFAELAGRRSESSHASRICAAEPASIDSMAPTGIELTDALIKASASR